MSAFRIFSNLARVIVYIFCERVWRMCALCTKIMKCNIMIRYDIENDKLGYGIVESENWEDSICYLSDEALRCCSPTFSLSIKIGNGTEIEMMTETATTRCSALTYTKLDKKQRIICISPALAMPHSTRRQESGLCGRVFVCFLCTSVCFSFRYVHLSIYYLKVFARNA